MIIEYLLLKFKFYARHEILDLLSKTPHKDLESHCYITGKTGSGKSSYILNLVYGRRYQSREKNNVSIVVLDPHGDMVDTIKRFDIATKYFDRIQYISPFLRKDMTPCINPLEIWDNSKESIDLTTQQLVRVFGEMIPEARLTNYMKALLKPCIYTLLKLKTCTLQDLQDFMSKNRFERRLNEGKRSAVSTHKRFFKYEFENRIYDGTK